MADTPVVFVVAGPRQAGKSTLAAHVVAGRGGTWLSLDDTATLDAARTDPVGFVTGRSLERRRAPSNQVTGRVIETFVTDELRSQAEWSATRPALLHFRDHDGVEVDLVLESSHGRVVGIEVKAGATVRADDLRARGSSSSASATIFAAGVVLCTAPAPLHLGGRLWTLPISFLWR